MMRSFLCFLLTVALVAVVGDVNSPGRGDVRPETYIRVDQFGYRPQDPKIAVIADPQVGFNSEASFSPGAIYEVRDADSGRTVDSGAIAPWMDG
jgi:endoglucanase